METYKVRCNDCGAEFTEIYPDGLEGDESYSSPDDPKPCDCESQYTILNDGTKRTVSVIHEGATTEIQWGSKEPQHGVIEGYVQIDERGRLVVPFRSDEGEPFVFVLGMNEEGEELTGIYPTEDAVAVQSVAPVWTP